uniref:Uncharacterized protein n=1 Tax=Thermosporothrix sp. COM3 TaxID=2490863 RepID=A0A455STC9_9CHLR|nr:hypothetical protein KTC_63780 [Thermosporothrix sp. COM3]
MDQLCSVVRLIRAWGQPVIAPLLPHFWQQSQREMPTATGRSLWQVLLPATTANEHCMLMLPGRTAYRVY